MKNHVFRFIALIFCISLLFSTSAVQSVKAQDSQPSSNSHPMAQGSNKYSAEGIYQDESGKYYRSSSPSTNQSAGSAIENTGGPDVYGYTWSDNVTLSWISVKTGTATGISSTTDKAGPFNIGFSFKYYENTYSQIYITKYGFISFNDITTDTDQSQIPSAYQPNNVIAPYWSPADYVKGYVRYLQGGTAPNRYLVVEWNNIGYDLDGKSDIFTFETILYENGDIVFQYSTMSITSNSYWCESSGIEDSYGEDGLSILGFCSNNIQSNYAVHIYRPASAAHLSIHPLTQGNFTSPGAVSSFQVVIKNTGELGSDTFDLTPSSTWTASFYKADGTTLLKDTNSNGVIDTGPVTQGGSVTIVAKIQTPNSGVVGDSNSLALTVRSSLNSSKTRVVTLQTAIPSSFAQGYTTDDNDATSLVLVQSSFQNEKKITSDYYYGNNPSISETPSGNFAYVWDKGSCINSCINYVDETYFTLLNAFGETIVPTEKLTDNSHATMNTYDYDPSVAVTPDGHIGILWIHEVGKYVNNIWTSNYNLYFQILDASGHAVTTPTNITNNTVWSDWSSTILGFYNAIISVTNDNRFIIVTGEETYTSSCTYSDCYVNNIYYAIRSKTGEKVKDLTQLTSDTPSNTFEAYYSPNVTAVNGNQALLSWERESDGNIYYAVINSSGTLQIGAINISNETYEENYNPDAVQLSDGNILVAWENDSDGITYAILTSGFSTSVTPVSLTNPSNISTGGDDLSVCADQSGHAILTWLDPFDRTLIYSLVDSSGSVITQPLVFRSSTSQEPGSLQTSYLGEGNTSYSTPVSSGIDTAVILAGKDVTGSFGNTAQINIQYANHGMTKATSIVLTATLDTGLTYSSDTSGITPAIVGNQVSWNLPDLSFLQEGQFTLTVGIPQDAAYGTHYTVAFTLTAPNESNPADNTAQADIEVAYQTFIPLLQR